MQLTSKPVARLLACLMMALMSPLVIPCHYAKTYCALVSCVMSVASAAEETSGRTTSRSVSPAGNSIDRDPDGPTAPAFTDSSTDAHTAPVLTNKQEKRAFRRRLIICQESLMKLEVADNGGSRKLTKPCGGLFVYTPSRGKMTAAATSKLDGPFRQKGCFTLLAELAEQNSWSADGSQNDPSLCTILQALLGNMLGAVSQQPDLLPMSGKNRFLFFSCAIVCCSVCICVQHTHQDSLRCSSAGSPEDPMDSLKKETLKNAVIFLATKLAILNGRGSKKAHQFKSGNPPSWWPENVPFIGYSEQTKPNLQLLLTALISLAKQQPRLHHDLVRVLWSCRSRLSPYIHAYLSGCGNCAHKHNTATCT